jgi:hypothetical protein
MNYNKGAKSMKVAKSIIWLGSLGMFVALINVFINGNLAVDGPKLLGNAWGIISLVDLYLGLILFAIWILVREKNIAVIVVLLALLMVLGFLAGSLYVLYNLKTSKGDWKKFFLGSRQDLFIEDK